VLCVFIVNYAPRAITRPSETPGVIVTVAIPEFEPLPVPMSTAIAVPLEEAKLI